MVSTLGRRHDARCIRIQLLQARPASLRAEVPQLLVAHGVECIAGSPQAPRLDRLVCMLVSLTAREWTVLKLRTFRGAGGALRLGRLGRRPSEGKLDLPTTDAQIAKMGRTGHTAVGKPRREQGAPSWSLTQGVASGTLVLRFIGPTATSDIPGFLAALTKQLPAQSAHVIFDLRELQGHNLDTRAPIQKWLLDNRPRIAQVTVVVKKAATILKMATSVVGLATGLKISIRDDLEGDASVLYFLG